ncbi:oligopeptide/dipeptide ABC transporter ATP-binding protein [Bilophila wadsworthia]|uniref:oligopeptide/dipeptide ABC transporter ATP-binding protein n=1 Tax=Bilophila wadsworthia TaxID=35833 RepID=UPI002430110A|nr:oligopeptide/dipeptide ABC transporter ATP-binding protein [Bilophila wadsworthia]
MTSASCSTCATTSGSCTLAGSRRWRTRCPCSRPPPPYTYSLLSVVPQVSRSPKGGRVKLLGDPPSPIDLKPGCRFNTRCPFAEDVCRHEEPELRKIGDNHFVACHLVRDGLGPHQRDGEWKV